METGEHGYINKNCWLVKTLNYAPYKRCQHCEFKFHDCLFLHYQVISLILVLFFLTLSFLIEGRLSELVVISVFTLVIVYGYFFNKSTDKIIKTSFAQRKSKKALEELTKGLEEKVKERTKELKSLAEELEEANIQIQSVEKMKSDLLNMASHEFRTPAGIIKNSIWFLNKEEEKKNFSDKAQQNLERMVDASERLDYILDNIEKMLETTAGDFKLDLSPVQLEILIKEVMEGKELGAQEKQVKLTFEEPKKLLPTINADATKLKYIFWELLTNALKYTDTGGSVAISAAQKDGLVEIKVKDTGCGIPKERLENIFTGFTKPDIIHTHQAGMGLGLYIVKKIIDLHHGQVQLQSEESKGTTVLITLPTA